MDKLVALCKRRGFIFQSSEIYGGIGGFWDYGPLGVELKRNVKNAWWTDIVRKRDDVVGLDCSIIMNPKVWEASGHVVNFNDPLIDCKKCKARFRADKVFIVIAADGENVLLQTGAEADDAEHAKEAAAAGANRALSQSQLPPPAAIINTPTRATRAPVPKSCVAISEATTATTTAPGKKPRQKLRALTGACAELACPP